MNKETVKETLNLQHHSHCHKALHASNPTLVELHTEMLTLFNVEKTNAAFSF